MAPAVPTLADVAPAMAACRAALREGSYTFFAASLLLPRAVRDPASVLYAFCRFADDAVDQGEDKGAAVRMLQQRLDRLDAEPRPEDRALAAVVAHFGIPREVPAALIEGFAWDAEMRRYETLEALQAYATRVAGTVGVMMALIMGARDARTLARAADLGVAMQLSNIARDVGEDARAGRLYLPLGWLRGAGIDADAFLAAPRWTPALGGVVDRLLAEADALYARADAGIGRLPLTCRPGINAARLLYAAIGHQVRRNGLDSVGRRAVVPRGRKLGLLLRAGARLVPPGGAWSQPCLPSNQALVDAAVAAVPAATPASLAWWQLARRVDERAGWLVDLFARLAREERMGPAPGVLAR